VATGDSVLDLLRETESSAVHLELRDQYMMDDPLVRAWQGGFRPSRDNRAEWWNDWYELVTETTGRGVQVRRARIVSEPLSEYVRCEYDFTITNLISGEDVRWLPRRNTTALSIPGNDFWLFDSRVLLVNHFAGDGTWVDTELVDDSTVIDFCAASFEAVWAIAVPHNEYKPA
jgi:hypothetical protein